MTIKDLAAKLSVSEMTLRRDYELLKENHNISMVNGVFVKNTIENIGEDDYYYFLLAKDKYQIEKINIGKYAASLINKYDTVALDIGTTTAQIAKYIPNYKEVTYVCYAYNILETLIKNNVKNIFLSGGMYQEETLAFQSSESAEFINKCRITKAFISAAGVSINLGVTCIKDYEVPLKKATMLSSVEKILVFDSSKYNRVKSAYFAELTDFSEIITDENIDNELVEYCEQNNIKVSLVPIL